MRVALVIAGPYPALRGSQVLVSHLQRGLAGRGHQVRVVSYGVGRGERPGPRPHRLLRDALLMHRLWRVVRRDGIELLHAHNYEAAIAALVVGRQAGIPVIYHGHSAHAAELPLYVSRPMARRAMARLGRFLDRHLPRRMDACIAVTRELGAYLHRAGVAAEALVCLEPALAPGELGPDTADGGGEDDGLVCYAGNLDGYQGLDELLRAFALVRTRLPSARLRLVSHPDARERAAWLEARGLGPGVEIVLVDSYATVCAELRRAAVAVSPRSEHSGYPMKLLSYLAHGKAVVASAGSAKGLVDGDTARVVPDGDAEAFATAVVALLRDPALRRRLGRAAWRRVADGAGWEAGLDRVEQTYRRALGRGAGRTARRQVAVSATE